MKKRNSNKLITSFKSKFLLVHSTSHHVHALTQILSSPEVNSAPIYYRITMAERSVKVATQLKDTKFAREGMMLQK